MIAIDFHNHIGKSKSDGALATAAQVRCAGPGAHLGLTHAVIFPVDESRPGISYSRLNTQVIKAVKQNKGLIGFCRLDPHFGNRAILEMRRSFKHGLVGVKLHPRSENFRPALAAGIVSQLNRLMRPLIIHTSHETNCRPKEWVSLLKRYPDFPVILAHGGKDAYEEAIAVAKKLPNVYLETSTLSFYRTRLILKKLGAGKIVFASDFPYSHPRLEMAKWNEIWNAREKQQILSKNAVRILEPWL